MNRPYKNTFARFVPPSKIRLEKDLSHSFKMTETVIPNGSRGIFFFKRSSTCGSMPRLNTSFPHFTASDFKIEKSKTASREICLSVPIAFNSKSSTLS